jgi:hypothetical protein
MLKMFLPAFAMHIKIINEYLQEFATQVLKNLYIVLVKVLVAFLRPNGMNVQSYNSVLMISVVFFMSSGAIQICQKLDCKSKAVNHDDFPNWLITSSTSGIGNESRHVYALSGR